MPRGRIRSADRPNIDWNSLPEPVVTNATPLTGGKRTAGQFDPRLREWVEGAHNTGSELGTPAPDKEQAEEIARQARALCRILNWTVKTRTEQLDGQWWVKVTARDRTPRGETSVDVQQAS